MRGGAIWSLLRGTMRFIDKVLTMLIQGAIIRAEGDRDQFDVIDHKTGKRK